MIERVYWASVVPCSAPEVRASWSLRLYGEPVQEATRTLLESHYFNSSERPLEDSFSSALAYWGWGQESDWEARELGWGCWVAPLVALADELSAFAECGALGGWSR